MAITTVTTREALQTVSCPLDSLFTNWPRWRINTTIVAADYHEWRISNWVSRRCGGGCDETWNELWRRRVERCRETKNIVTTNAGNLCHRQSVYKEEQTISWTTLSRTTLRPVLFYLTAANNIKILLQNVNRLTDKFSEIGAITSTPNLIASPPKQTAYASLMLQCKTKLLRWPSSSGRPTNAAPPMLNDCDF